MISSQGLKEKQFAVEPNGYSIKEVDAVIAEAAATIDAYAVESEDLYHKMEVLAAKIEEYREEEDSIKSALITAQKMADKITKESSETAAALITGSEATAKATVEDANAKAEKIVSEAREYAAKLISEKTEEANKILSDAREKANEAINSSKIISKDVLDQAKAISDDLINKSKEEQEAYSLLTDTIKSDALRFINQLKALYTKQLEVLESANLEASREAEIEEQRVDSAQEEIDSLISEIDEMEQAIPEEIPVADDDAEEEPAAEDIQDTVLPTEDAAEKEPEDNVEFVFEETEIEPEKEEDPAPIEIIDDEPADPMEAVEAFSTDEITPIPNSSVYIPEINEDAQMEDASLFDNGEQPFESYFNIKREDDPSDRTETISLVPPDSDDDDDEEPKFKGFFKKKK